MPLAVYNSVLTGKEGRAVLFFNVLADLDFRRVMTDLMRLMMEDELVMALEGR